MKRQAVRTHRYVADVADGPDHHGDYRCFCGLPAGNAVHRLKERSDEEKAAEARRTGEREIAMSLLAVEEVDG